MRTAVPAEHSCRSRLAAEGRQRVDSAAGRSQVGLPKTVSDSPCARHGVQIVQASTDLSPRSAARFEVASVTWRSQRAESLNQTNTGPGVAGSGHQRRAGARGPSASSEVSVGFCRGGARAAGLGRVAAATARIRASRAAGMQGGRGPALAAAGTGGAGAVGALARRSEVGVHGCPFGGG